jgi:large subunit ribosomal protein L25
MHIDLLEVRLDEKIQAPVSLHIEGAEEAPGVKEGGVMEQVTHQLNIEALPTDIPDSITADVSGMEIAATMNLSELAAPPGVEFLDDPEETIIATVVVPTEVEEPEEIEEETELVGEEAEAEAEAEGEPAAEAEPAADEGGEPEE